MLFSPLVFWTLDRGLTQKFTRPRRVREFVPAVTVVRRRHTVRRPSSRGRKPSPSSSSRSVFSVVPPVGRRRRRHGPPTRSRLLGTVGDRNDRTVGPPPPPPKPSWAPRTTTRTVCWASSAGGPSTFATLTCGTASTVSGPSTATRAACTASCTRPYTRSPGGRTKCPTATRATPAAFSTWSSLRTGKCHAKRLLRARRGQSVAAPRCEDGCRAATTGRSAAVPHGRPRTPRVSHSSVPVPPGPRHDTSWPIFSFDWTVSLSTFVTVPFFFDALVHKLLVLRSFPYFYVSTLNSLRFFSSWNSWCKIFKFFCDMTVKLTLYIKTYIFKIKKNELTL